MFNVLTYNNIPADRLSSLPGEKYALAPQCLEPDAILLRSFDLHGVAIPDTVLAVGRAGSGVTGWPRSLLSNFWHFRPFGAGFGRRSLLEPDRDLFEAIRKVQIDSANANVWDPIEIDLAEPGTWSNASDHYYDVIFAINLFQAAPVAIADGVAQLAARVLKDTGFLAIYGPFKVDGRYTTPSNEAFDQELLEANVPDWGLKDIRDMQFPMAAVLFASQQFHADFCLALRLCLRGWQEIALFIKIDVI